MEPTLQTPIPAYTRVSTPSGVYQRNADGTSVRVGALQAPQPVNFMADAQQHAANMRQMNDNALNAAMAQNRYATDNAVMQYQNQTRGINQTAEAQARQAYVQRLRAMNNLPRLLRAQGITGGAAESTAARMSGSFDNAQFGIMKNRDNLLHDIQSRIAQARNRGDQSAANIKAQHATQRMQLEQTLADRQIQAQDRTTQAWNERRAELIATIPQHYNDFQAFINHLDEFGDPYNIRGHVVKARNEKIANAETRAEADAERDRITDEMGLIRHIESLRGLPPEVLMGHASYFPEGHWIHNTILHFAREWYQNEEERQMRRDTHGWNMDTQASNLETAAQNRWINEQMHLLNMANLHARTAQSNASAANSWSLANSR